VDDEEPILRLEKQMLERLGYHVSTRTSSVDALAAFQVNPDAYDLVITDMAMPNMTGDQLAQRMLSVRADIPVILCTGFSDKMTATKAKSLGIKGFLKKPLVRGDLAGTVRKVLDEAIREEPRLIRACLAALQSTARASRQPLRSRTCRGFSGFSWCRSGRRCPGHDPR
jgi:DNA-binding NtrC family response regulator